MTSVRDRNRQVVVDFYTTAFIEHRHAEAVERCVGETYIQHNPFVPDGREGFLKFFESWQDQRSPEFRQRILRVVADEELVAVHATIRKDDEDRGTVLVDIFRMEDGKIVEHWDAYKELPDPLTIPHNNGIL